MKKLLFILLFFACKAEGQIAITNSTAAYLTTDFGSSIVLTSRSYVSGRLYLIAVQVSKDTPPNEPSIAGTSQTWTKIEDISSRTIASPTSRIALFRFLSTSTFTENTTITIPTGDLHTGNAVIEIELTGMVTTGTNGADAIVQAVTNSVDAGANPSITMAAISSGRNAVFSFFTNNANPFGGTPESSWTELYDGGYATPNTGAYVMYRMTTTDNTPTVTASASDWAGIAIEIKSEGRRRIIID